MFNSIWKKVKRNSQYQDQSIQDGVAYLEYLQFIIIEFDSKWAPEEGMMIWYFRESLYPSVRVEMEQCGRELNNFKELVEKAVNAKANAALPPRSYAPKIDQYCFRGSRPSAAKASTQGQPMKDPKIKKPKKPQELKASAPQRSNSSKTSENARNKKKKKKSNIGAKSLKKAPLQPPRSKTALPEGYNCRKMLAKSPASIATK